MSIGREGTPVGEMPLVAQEMYLPPESWGSDTPYGMRAEAILTDDGRGVVTVYCVPIRHASFFVPAEARKAGKALIALAKAAEQAEKERSS